MRFKLHFLWLVVALVGCASLGLEQAKSFDQKLAYAYGTYTAVQNAAATAVTAGTLSKADGAQALKLGDEARTLLDSAKTIADSGDPDAANNKLLLATAILTQLQTYLNSRRH